MLLIPVTGVMPLSGAAELDVLSSATKDRRNLKDLTGLDPTDAKKETDGVISNQLGVMVGLLLRLHYHTLKDSNLVGTFEPDTGHVIPYQPHSLTSQN
ncbi:uncharacterized protein FRV6_06503 [Fusarium oxysporum]|uniref:Uncharacterized protein n=1 Tax=Fusarium oxysporum TaxID=5507 RepID=A0A2H3TGV2_FUSOX|nr:uncharacterized protein FRV6_06503 [Fusarium oxysporum]